MSTLAEYANELHRNNVITNTTQIVNKNLDINTIITNKTRAVIFDVYGTIIDNRHADIDNPNYQTVRQEKLLHAAKMVIEKFGLDDTLKKINPETSTSQTLVDFVSGLVAITREKAGDEAAAEKELVEIRIENVWQIILMILTRNGYDPAPYLPRGASREDLHRYFAYTYNFYSAKRALFANVAKILLELKNKNIVLGLLANGQFYTPIDLTLLLRDANIGIDDFNELFEPELTFFSYEYGFLNTANVIREKLFDVLRADFEIEELDEVVFV